MQYRNKLAISLLVANSFLLVLPATSSAQDINWQQNIIKVSSSAQSRQFSDNDLPGVSSDPYAAREARKFCTEVSLGEALGDDFLSGKCPRSPLTVFEIPTDVFLGSSK